MPEDQKSNFEVKAVEAALQNLQIEQIKPVNLNRDELMYNAGWAAAMANISEKATTSIGKPISTTRAAMVWPVVSAITATAALIFAMLFFNQATNSNSNELTEVAKNADNTSSKNALATGQANSEKGELSNSQQVNSQQGKRPDLLRNIMTNQGPPPTLRIKSDFVTSEVESDSEELLRGSEDESWRATANVRRVMSELLPGVASRKSRLNMSSWESVLLPLDR